MARKMTGRLSTLTVVFHKKSNAKACRMMNCRMPFHKTHEQGLQHVVLNATDDYVLDSHEIAQSTNCSPGTLMIIML